jgi:cob(I)alamin adenosyltransferase
MRPSISTRTGDSGKTGLFGGQRVSKHSTRLHTYGTVDELNSVLGIVLAEPGVPQDIVDDLETIQRVLFSVGADLATPSDSAAKVDRVSVEIVTTLEKRALEIENRLEQLTHFILPGGSRVGALLHQARTVCRRAERWVVALQEKEEVNEYVCVYLNRLSDYFFLAARLVNKKMGVVEGEWRG